MKFRISVYDVTASELVEIAVAAEAAGFDSLWLGEHLLLPAGYDAVHPTKEAAEERAAPIVAAETRLTDPLLALAAAAARTERIQLATGIFLANLRHPLATARAAVTLQELAGGRFLLGVAAAGCARSSRRWACPSPPGPPGWRRASTSSVGRGGAVSSTIMASSSTSPR